MAYTINSGVHRETWQRFVRDSSLALPIIAILFIIIAAVSVSTNQSSGQSPYIPVKKQASLNASTAGPKTSPSSNNKSASSPTKTFTSSTSTPTPAMSFNTLGSSTPATSLPATGGITGGLGGGDVLPSGGTSGGSTSGGSTSGTSAPAPTIVCTNLLTLAQVCTACTPPLTLQPGQKALLSADGTCVAAN